MEKQQIACPFCGEEQDFSFHPEVDISREPGLKDAVTSGTIFDMVCVKCGRTVRVGYPLVYSDPALKLRLYLIAADEDGSGLSLPPASEGWRILRAVHYPGELAEKILAFDAGLDDRTLQIVKQVLSASLESVKGVHATDITLSGVAGAMLFLVETKEQDFPSPLPFDQEVYKEVHRAFSPFYPKGVRENLLVDEDWARQLLKPADTLQ